MEIETILSYVTGIITLLLIIVRITPTQKDDLVVKTLSGKVGIFGVWLNKALFILDKALTSSNRFGLSKVELKLDVAFHVLNELIKLHPEDKTKIISLLNLYVNELSKPSSFLYKTDIEEIIDELIEEVTNKKENRNAV
jgi:hypothetical protein